MRIRYALIIALTLLVAGIVFMPARLLWAIADAEARADFPPELSVKGIQGTLWHGAAHITWQPPDETPIRSRLSWNIHAGALIGLQLRSDLHAAATDHDLQTRVTVQRDRKIEIKQLRGHIHAALVNRLGRRYGLQTEGTLQVADLSASLVRNPAGTAAPLWAETLTGRLAWDGGEVIYQTRTSRTAYPLPPLQATLLHLPAGRATSPQPPPPLRLELLHQDGPLADTTLHPDGHLLVQVYQRLFELTDTPWPSGGRADDIALEIEEVFW